MVINLIKLLVIISLLTSCSPNNSDRPKSNEVVTFVAPSGSPPVDSIVWSPISNDLLITAGDIGQGRAQIYVLNLTTGNKHILSSTESGNFIMSTWAPDGNRVLVLASKNTMGSGAGGLWILNTDNLSLEYFLDSGRAAWSPDGQRIATFTAEDVNNRLTLKLINVHDKVVTSFYKNMNMKYPFGLSWSPDGQNLVYSLGESAPGNLYVINLLTKQTTKITENVKSADLAWSPVGDIIAYTSWPSEGTKTTLHLISPKGACDITIPNLEYVWSPTWSPDGTKLGYVGSNGIYVLDINRVLGRDIYKNLCQ